MPQPTPGQLTSLEIVNFGAGDVRLASVNVLFNGAGIMRVEGSLDKIRDLSDAEASITSNLLGPIRVTNALIDHLGHQTDAVIVNVSSGLAFVPLVIAPTYSAINAAIHSYTEWLRAVLKDRIEVIELVPPAVQTDLTPGQRQTSVSCRSIYLPIRSSRSSSRRPRRARSWWKASTSCATPRPSAASTMRWRRSTRSSNRARAAPGRNAREPRASRAS
jgi:uncharacterized oxidoreductase